MIFDLKRSSPERCADHAASAALRSGSHAATRRLTRPGVIVLELILVLPVLLIALLAIVEFGSFFVKMQQVALACRVGAEAASQTPGLPSSGAVPATILDQIDKQLGSSGISRCHMRLEHNRTGPVSVLTSPTSGGCDCGPTTNLSPTPPRTYVRLSICVPLVDLMPNCLSSFGFDISGPNCVAECSSVFRYEL